MNSAMRWSWMSRFMAQMCHESGRRARKASREAVAARDRGSLRGPGRVDARASRVHPRSVNDPISRRLPHVLTRSDLAWILVPTYAAALGVDEEEARERLERAFAV